MNKPKRIQARKALALGLAMLAIPAAADEAEDAFVEANLLAIFYHELGHALIDVMRLPVFGQEEDAADVASIFLIDWIFENEAAIDLAYDASFGLAAEAMMEEGSEIAYWGVHGASAQRFYNTVCLFYGADPDTRDDFAADMDLPKDRAETCPEEFALADESWGPVLDELAEAQGHALTLGEGAVPGLTTDLMTEELGYLADEIALPEKVTVYVEPCDEPNAFYIPAEKAIVMCTEFAPYLRDLYRQSLE